MTTKVSRRYVKSTERSFKVLYYINEHSSMVQKDNFLRTVWIKNGINKKKCMI